MKLMLGDCVEKMAELQSESVDLVITSPPYPGVMNMWGELYMPENFEKAHAFLDTVWDECVRLLRPGCKLIINVANTKRNPYLPNTGRIYQWYFRNQNIVEAKGEIIWNKGYGQLGTAWGSFRSPADMSLADQHEYILVFRKIGDRDKPDEFEKISLKNFKSWRNSVWTIAPAKASKIGHCAPFPIIIPKRLMILYSFEGETVLDPFMGSGTTGIACIDTQREFIGIELREDYYKLAGEIIENRERQEVLF